MNNHIQNDMDSDTQGPPVWPGGLARYNSFTGGRAFDPEPRHPLSHSRDRVLHPSSGIWLISWKIDLVITE